MSRQHIFIFRDVLRQILIRVGVRLIYITTDTRLTIPQKLLES